MRYRRMPIEIESPEQLGYDTITNNLSESSVADRRLSDLGIGLAEDGSGAGTALEDLLGRSVLARSSELAAALRLHRVLNA